MQFVQSYPFRTQSHIEHVKCIEHFLAFRNELKNYNVKRT